MKKALVILLCALAVFAIVSCKEEPAPKKVEKVEVTFELGSGVTTASVAKGAAVAKPEDPTKTDFAFGGWYQEATYENEYDFATPVTEDTTVYAKWTSVDPNVFTKTYKLTAVKAEQDRFQLRFKSSGDNAFLTGYKEGDVVSYKFRSTPVEGSAAVTALRVRGASSYGGTSNFSGGIVKSEADADGWITVTCTFAEGMDFTETGLLMDFRLDEGNIAVGDVLEICDLKFNDQEISWVAGSTSAGPYEGCEPTWEIVNPFYKYKLKATLGTDGVDDHKYDQDKFRLIWTPAVSVNPGDVVTIMFKAVRTDEMTAGRPYTYSIREPKKWFSEKQKGDEYPQFWSVFDDSATDGWIVASYVFPSVEDSSGENKKTKEEITYPSSFVIDFRDSKIAVGDILLIRSIKLTQGETTTDLVLDKAAVSAAYSAPTIEEI